MLNWKRLIEHPAFKQLDMQIHTGRPGHGDIVTTRCPIRFDGKGNMTGKWAPHLGEDTETIIRDYGLVKGVLTWYSKTTGEPPGAISRLSTAV